MLKKLRSDQRGAAAIEFAFALPIVLLLVLGAIELGYTLFVNSVLEGAVREASRTGVTGYAPCGMTRDMYIEAVIDQKMGGYADPERRTVEKTVYESFQDIEGEPFADMNGNGVYNAGEPFSDVNGNAVYDRNLGSAGLGGAGAIVIYDVSYELNSLSGWFAKQIGSERGVVLSASATVRNEPASIDGNFGAEIDDCDVE